MAPATFYFDLGSPYAYLSAERLPALLGESVTWQPVALGALFRRSGRNSWGLGDDRRAGIDEVQRRARDYGLGPVRWPDGWPSDYLMANRAATFAFTAGRGPQFTLQAFRDAFQRGSDLSVADRVLDVAQAVGLDRDEVAAATQDPQIKLALREATDAAYALGVTGVPTVAVDGELFWGDDRLAEAAARCSN
jgi:2-hydroxychromene-2-carboxylate isomerase